ncbi:MAG: N-acetyltransferase [Nitratireductor sp.]|nr:N-acetyltransferase [Nitratireductor sp.]
MSSITLKIAPETAEQNEAVEWLGARAFGPGRFARAAFRLREGVGHERAFSFTAVLEDGNGGHVLAGSVRLTRILIGDNPALMLGPLVVSPHFKNLGIGRELMNRSLRMVRLAGERFVFLVGDEPYYRKFGFKALPVGRIILPGPADPARMLYCEMQAGALSDYSGMARRFVQ